MSRLVASLCLALAASSAAADGTAGRFDYYVLSLSWSPNWCDREGRARNSPQCDPARELGWVLHGLWPQYERGWPSFCPTSIAPPSRAQTAGMADIMGDGGSAWYQWRKHGVCAGLEAVEYFAAARQAFDVVVKPPVLDDLDRAVTLPADVIEDAFLRSNPHLGPDMVTVTCRDSQIQEVRICLAKDLTPRDCAPDVRVDCALTDALFLPSQD